MKVEVSMSQIYENPHTFQAMFFRKQSAETLDELMNCVSEVGTALDRIEDYSEDLEEVEELLYSESVEDLIEIFGLEDLVDESDDEEDEENREDE